MYRGGGREGGREQGCMYTFARERERIRVYVYNAYILNFCQRGRERDGGREREGVCYYMNVGFCDCGVISVMI